MLRILPILFTSLATYSFCQDLTKLTDLIQDLQSQLSKECAPLGKILSQMPQEVQTKLAVNIKSAPSDMCFDCNNLADVAKSYADWISANNKSNTDYMSAKKKPLANCSVLQDSLSTSGVNEAVTAADDISTAINKVVPETQIVASSIKSLVESVWKFNFRLICTSKADITSAVKDSDGYYTSPSMTRSEGNSLVKSFIDLLQSNDNINNAVADSTSSCLNKVAMLDKCRLNDTLITTNSTDANNMMLPSSSAGNGNKNNKINKLDKMPSCQSMSTIQNQNKGQSLTFESLKKILNSLPAATTANRVLQPMMNPKGSDSNCGVGFGSNGQPQLPIPQSVLDSAQATLTNFAKNYDSEAATFFSNIFNPNVCTFRRLNEKLYLDKPTDNKGDLACQSGTVSQITCVKGGDGSTECTCKRGTCGSIARTHSSDQVKQNNANQNSFRFDFICSGSTDVNKPTIFMMTYPKITNSTTVLCEADVKLGNNTDLGASASSAISNCADLGIQAALTGQVTAQAMQRGLSRTEDIQQIGNQCFSPMKDDCKQKIINSISNNNLGNSTQSSDQSQVLNLCNNAGLTDDQLKLCISFILNRAFNGMKIKPVADMAAAVSVISATTSLRILQTAASAPSPLFVEQTNTSVEAQIDPIKLNIASSISIDGTTPANQASVSDQLKEVQAQKIQLGGNSAIASLSLVLICFLVLIGY